MIKQEIWGFLLLVLLPLGSMAQDVELGDRQDRIKAMRIAYLTERMNLTPEQSEKFWPVHDAMDAEIRTIERRKNNALREGDLSNDEADALIQQRFDAEAELLRIKRNYYDKFKQIVTPRQVLMYQRASREFKRDLLRRLQRRRG